MGKITEETSGAKWRDSLLRSALTALFLLAVYAATILLDIRLLVLPLGSSAFVAFAFPTAESTRPRFFIGGYACGVLGGIIGSVLRGLCAQGGDSSMLTVVFCVLAVFLCTLTMTRFDFEHPPAVALALGITLSERPFMLAAAAAAGILLLCGIKHVLGRVKSPKNA